MNQCTVNSSDLALARALSRRLTGSGEGEDTAAVLPENGYRRFDVGTPARYPTDSGERIGTNGPPPHVLEPHEMPSWDSMLAWSMELCGSRAGFVVDSQGFVIASRGNIPDDGFEGMGAELCFAMEQLDKLDSNGAELKAVELQFEAHTVAAIRIAPNDDMGGFILGFVGSQALIPEIRDAVIRQANLGIGHMI